MRIPLEMNKNLYKEEFGFCLFLSLQKPKTYGATGAFLKTLCALDSFEKYK